MGKEEDEAIFRKYLGLPDTGEAEEPNPYGLSDEEYFKRFLNGELHEETFSSNKPKKKKKQKDEQVKEEDERLFLEYISRGGVHDKDKASLKSVNEFSAKRKSSKQAAKKISKENTLDLHGMAGAEARRALENFVRSASKQKRNPVMIVHGKGLHSDGRGVLKGITMDFLNSASGRRYVLEHKPAPYNAGGSGATILWIRWT